MTESHFPSHFPILGVLMADPAHGYELQNRLSASLGPIWHIASSQLYSTLHNLEDKGLLTSTVEPQSSKPDKKVYSLTTEGQSTFWEWVTTPVKHPRNLRVEFLAKICFLHQLSPKKASKLIADQIQLLKNIEDGLSHKQSVAVEDEVVGKLALLFRLGRVRSAISWLNSCTQVISPEKGEERTTRDES